MAHLRYAVGREFSSKPQIMKRVLASIFTTVLIVAMSLGAMFILVQATVYVTAIPSTLQRAAAMAAEMLLGVVLLLGTVWLATHLAVRIFKKDSVLSGESLVG
jgi:hypothetical protein